jgi:hypothetical protein
MTDQIMTLAEGLAGGTGRYVDDKRLRAAGRKFGLSFDDARRAGIIADRLRRERQAADGLLVEAVRIDAPIALLDHKDRRRGVE